MASAAVAAALAVDHVHLLHQHVVGEVREMLGDLGVVQREIGQFALAIPPSQLADLGGADAAIAVVNDDVGLGPVGWVGRRSAAGSSVTVAIREL